MRQWQHVLTGGRLAGLLLLVSVGVSMSVSAALAQPVNEHAKQTAERQREALQQKLNQLKRDIDRTEAAKGSAADALAASEEAISTANRALRELSEQQQAAEVSLAQLVQQQGALSAVVRRQQVQLSTLLREQYVAGNEDRIKLLLSGDNPNRINRELQYMGYVSQAQAKLIDTLRLNLQGVRDNKAKTQNIKFALDEIEQGKRAQKTLLEREQAKRATLLSQLSSKLSAQRQEVGKVERDEQRLSGLLDKLTLLIEAQKKADAAARERQAQLAKVARARRLARAKTRPAQPAAADVIESDEAPLVGDDHYGPALSSLRGKLRLPVRGELIGKFGARRGDGPTAKGWFIRAAEGSEVRAVAAGRVVYADWLRGFGNLLIVDHGQQYMTIYGNNQAVLKHAGDMVKSGEVIGSAGNSGGNEQSGLYFEMRHQGRAFDPLGWVTIR